MAAAVDIYLKDDSASPAPIIGAVVGVFDATTLDLLAQATTSSEGQASFLLPGSVSGTSYEVRFFKQGVLFANPVNISVLDPLTGNLSNAFDFVGTLIDTLPVATDPRLCRCTGRFVDFSNTPIANTVLQINAKADSGFQIPKLVDGNMVSSSRMVAHSDDDGFVKIDLIRTGQYVVSFAGEEDNAWDIFVPDRANVNLMDLIHPYPVSLAWSSDVAPGNALSIAVGQTVSVPFSALFSNYLTIYSGLLQWVRFFVGDDSIADVDVGDGLLTIRGVAAGSTTVTGSNQDELYPARVPSYATSIPTLTVTVTA